MTNIGLIEEFDRNAGKVWSTLNTVGPMQEARLMNTLTLNENAFYAAIGWLAREGKIETKSILRPKSQ